MLRTRDAASSKYDKVLCLPYTRNAKLMVYTRSSWCILDRRSTLEVCCIIHYKVIMYGLSPWHYPEAG